ncbi:hypothetical protein MMS63_29140, partial [Escherichia coli]|nr:hypothetical protein [Escherichia coli]
VGCVPHHRTTVRTVAATGLTACGANFFQFLLHCWFWLLFFWPGDVDAGNIDGTIHRWATNEVIDKDREDWKRISASMRKQP